MLSASAKPFTPSPFAKASEKSIKVVDAHSKKVHSLAWNSNGTRLASGSADKTAKIWNAEMKEIMECRGHSDSVEQLAWDPTTPDRLATCSGDQTVKLWDARDKGRKPVSIKTSGENINVAYSPDGKYIAVGNKEDCISIIDTRKSKVIKRTNFKYEVNEFSWDTTGKYFFLTTGQSSGGGTIEVLEFGPKGLKALKTLPAHSGHCYCLDVDPNGGYIAVGSADTMMSVWSLTDLICVQTFARLEWQVRSVGFSFDGAYIAGASEDMYIDIADAKTGEQAYKLVTNAAMNALAWHPSKYVLAFAGDTPKERTSREREGTIKVFAP